MAISFVTAASALAGNPLPVTVYDGLGAPIDNSLVSWGTLPAGLSATPDPVSSTGRWTFSSATSGGYQITAHVGGATGSLGLTFLGLKFSSP